MIARALKLTTARNAGEYGWTGGSWTRSSSVPPFCRYNSRQIFPSRATVNQNTRLHTSRMGTTTIMDTNSNTGTEAMDNIRRNHCWVSFLIFDDKNPAESKRRADAQA